MSGELVPVPGTEDLSPADTQRLCFSVMTDAQKQKFDEEHEVDFSFGIRGLARFRANVFRQRGAVAGAFRRIPYEVMPMSKRIMTMGVERGTADHVRQVALEEGMSPLREVGIRKAREGVTTLEEVMRVTT